MPRKITACKKQDKQQGLRYALNENIWVKKISTLLYLEFLNTTFSYANKTKYMRNKKIE